MIFLRDRFENMHAKNIENKEIVNLEPFMKYL